MENLEAFAKGSFDALYDKHQSDFVGLPDDRRQHYATLQLQSPTPEAIPWEFPASIDFNRSTEAVAFDKHLYVQKDGSFKADLGNWESGVLAEELADDSVVAWLRNVDRKAWALEIPYVGGGTIHPMFPDLLIVRKNPKGFVFDILEPHNASLNDNLAKAKGLAKFAAEHGGLFGRIELIRKHTDASNTRQFFRLDMRKSAVRNLVNAADTNNRLDEIFKQKAAVRS